VTSVKTNSGLTLRSVLVGLLLTPPVTWWVVKVEYVQCTLHPTLISLFATSVFALTLVILANSVIRRVLPGRQLSQSELITVYVMLNISTALASHHCLQVLVSSIPFAARAATPFNNWGAMFADGLPDWLTVRDPIALKAFYEGGSLYDPANYGPWIVPIICWTAFILVMAGMFVSINVIFRAQWTEREKLSYPLVQLPLDMTEERSPLFRNALFWIGFGVVAAIDILNGLSLLYPSVPQIPVKSLSFYLNATASRPWSALGWLPFMFYPFGIGLGMLLPVDMLFSCWFFFWAWKAEAVLTAMLGLDSIPQMPYVSQQSLGGFIGIAVFALAMSRRHLREVWKRFLGKSADIDDSGEAMSYRSAMWCVLLGSVFLIGFARLSGMSLWLAVLFFAIYFAISLAVTRMRAEMGLPAHDLERGGPDAILGSVIGSRTLGTQDLASLSMFQWFNRGYQSHQMPLQLEGFKMGRSTGMRDRSLLVAIWIATVAGTLVGFWVLLHIIYSSGGATSRFSYPICPMHLGSEPWNRMASWATTQAAPAIDQGFAVVVGFGVTMLLGFLRVKFIGFPFHPGGYAVSGSWSMHVLWLPMFIAWMIKLPVLRYGGLKLYRRVLPIFLGLLLGDCLIGCFWTVIGAIWNLPSYRFFP